MLSGGSEKRSRAGLFARGQQRVVEGLIGRDLCFVAGQVFDVVLVGH